MKRNRKRIRMKGYDYSGDGWYFVTICTKYKHLWFGKIINGKMQLNRHGEIIQYCWHDLVNHYQNIKLDEFVVMTDHVHGIIIIENHEVRNKINVEYPVGARHALPQFGNQDKSFNKALPQPQNENRGKKSKRAGCAKPQIKNGNGDLTRARHALPVRNEDRRYSKLSVGIGSFKSSVTRMINREIEGERFKWQRSFYDKIIRDEIALRNIRKYISENPTSHPKHHQNRHCQKDTINRKNQQ